MEFLWKMLYLLFVVPEFSLVDGTLHIFMGFSFTKVCFSSTKQNKKTTWILKVKGKWKGKLENGSGLKNTVMYLWIKKKKKQFGNGNLMFQILLMSQMFF